MVVPYFWQRKLIGRKLYMFFSFVLIPGIFFVRTGNLNQRDLKIVLFGLVIVVVFITS